MKKILLSVILLSAVSYAGDDDSTDYSPIYISSSGTRSNPTLITFNAIPAGSKTKNCITDISMSADNFTPTGFILTILDGGTTAYQISQTTAAIVESWYPRNPLCLSLNTTTYINVSTGTFKLNVSGYEKSR